MPTRPSSLPDWATSVLPADTAVPPAATKSGGWLTNIKPPHEWVNWFWGLVYEWILMTSKTTAFYDDMDDAIDDLAAGDTCILYEADTAGTEDIRKATGITSGTYFLADIDTCGDLVVYGSGTNDPVGVTRDLDQLQAAGAPLVTYVRTNAGSVYNIRTNGVITVVAYGTATFYVEAFNALTGASLWIHDNDSDPIYDLCIQDNLVLIAHTETSGVGDTVSDRHLHALNAATGAVVWSYEHTAGGTSQTALCSNGRQVFFSAGASSFASGANLRALRFADGYDFDAEGSGTADDTGVAWNVVMASVAEFGCMACDRKLLFIGKGSGATFQIQCRSIADGATVWSVAHPDATMHCNSIVVDHEYVYAAMSDRGAPAKGFVEVYEKLTGAMVWRWAANDLTATYTACLALAVDGSKLFAVAEDEDEVFRVNRGNVPRMFHRVDPTTYKDGIRNLKLQPELS